MRSFLARCLILLLSFALVGGNAPAALDLGGAHPESVPEEHAHHSGKTSPHRQNQHDHGLACCCDCLGCTSSACLPPELTIALADHPAQIHYDALVASLSGRALLPEPDPPRPSTLS